MEKLLDSILLPVIRALTLTLGPDLPKYASLFRMQDEYMDPVLLTEFLYEARQLGANCSEPFLRAHIQAMACYFSDALYNTSGVGKNPAFEPRF
jgi:hypothetical protein